MDDLGEKAEGALLGMEARALIARQLGDQSTELAELQRAVDGRLKHLVDLDVGTNCSNEGHAWATLELANRYIELGHHTKGRQLHAQFEAFCLKHGLPHARLSQAAQRGRVAIYVNSVPRSPEQPWRKRRRHRTLWCAILDSNQ